jgi:uncharacterized protein
MVYPVHHLFAPATSDVRTAHLEPATKTEFPHAYHDQEHVPIPMLDGARLSARIWLPEHAHERPVPAVLEYIPYRKRDFTRRSDEQNHGYFAGHGYAGIRVDIRGSGESEGLLRDEYLQQELDDGVEIIRWIAKQPWCDGNVGMIGISWGGFNALQIAELQPPALKAVIAVAASDDRYRDDVHYMGGCLLGDNLSWASTMLARNAKPPDPELVGERWREMWLERLEHSGLWLKKWLEHQHRDDYWKHASVNEDYGAIECPVMAVSGWADGYTNAVFRLMHHLKVPRRGLVGPWSHRYPHQGEPGPAVGFLQEAVRWWDRWLKGIDNGVDAEPLLQGWMQDSVRPTTSYQTRPGRWVAEREWPSPRINWKDLRLTTHHLREDDQVPTEATCTIQSPLSVGLFAGKWCAYAATPDLPHDQREEDGGAHTFESSPLEETLEIFGGAVVELEFQSDQPVAMVAARLCDVHENGAALRVAYGLENLTHIHGHESPRPLEPGTTYKCKMQLNDIGHRFPKGHRLRLSISTSYWPLAWPPPRLATLKIHTNGSRLRLPVRPPSDEDQRLRPMGAPEVAPASTIHQESPKNRNWYVHRDLARDISTLEVIKDEGLQYLEDIDLHMHSSSQELYSYQVDDPESARGETHWEDRFRRGGWNVRTVSRTTLTSDKTHFRIRATLDAWEGETRIFSKNWDERIERRLV